MNQRGFATLEVILMVVILGILATVAVPRFTDVTTKANTAKIQSDLTTIDTAIQLYYMEKGSYTGLSTVDNLTTAGYLMDTPKPPTGSAFLNGTATEIASTTTTYSIVDDPKDTSNSTSKAKRAVLNIGGSNHVAGDFSVTATTTTTNL